MRVDGTYRHYKGGRYTALCLARDHETREIFVVYVSHTTGAVCIRPFATPGKDSWTDMVDWGGGEMFPRFLRQSEGEQPK